MSSLLIFGYRGCTLATAGQQIMKKHKWEETMMHHHHTLPISPPNGSNRSASIRAFFKGQNTIAWKLYALLFRIRAQFHAPKLYVHIP